MESTRRFLGGDGGPASDEYRIVLPDGRVRWIHDRALLLADADTGELLVHGVLVDVTDERTSLEVAERVGMLFRTLVEHAREAVTIVDEHGVVRLPEPVDGAGGGAPAGVVQGQDAARSDAARGRGPRSRDPGAASRQPRLPAAGGVPVEASRRLVADRRGGGDEPAPRPCRARDRPELPGRHSRARAGAPPARCRAAAPDAARGHHQRRGPAAVEDRGGAPRRHDSGHGRRADGARPDRAAPAARRRRRRPPCDHQRTRGADEGHGSHAPPHVRASSRSSWRRSGSAPPSAIWPTPCIAIPASR